MRVTHLGHACLLVEIADTRVLIDPGSFSQGFEELRDLDVVVVTHQHADHLDQERLPALLRANRQAAVHADPQTAELLDTAGVDVVTLSQGNDLILGPLTLTPVGELHATNHDGVPRPTNVGVVVRADGEPSLYHPGDAYDGVPGTSTCSPCRSTRPGPRSASRSTSSGGSGRPASSPSTTRSCPRSVTGCT